MATDGGTYVQRYGYDADGNRSAVAYPSGRIVTYQHDYAGRPLTATGTMAGQATPYVTAATYLPFGPLTSLGLGNGTAETRTFNARYLPATSSLTLEASTIAQYAYTNDPAGDITSVTDGVDAGYSRTFGYDDLHRLTVANTGTSLWGAGSFTYDRMGNMLTATLGGSQRSFTHQGATPRIGMATGLSGTMAYDDAGNELDSPAGEPALGGTAAVRYSPRNLIEAQLLRTYDRCVEEHGSACTQPDPAEDWQTNVYDGRGVRVLSTRIVVAGSIGLDPPPTHVYFYTPELAMLNVVSHSTGRTADVIWFGSRPVADHGTSQVRYTYTDHLKTPILQTTASGTVTWRVEYEPYGSVYALRSGVATDDQPLRFPGQQVSHSTAAGEESYNVFRWYRSRWGRYTQADPALNPYSLREGPYSYVAGNPVRFKDRLGLTCGPCCSTPAQISADKDKIIKSVHAELAKYMAKTLWKPYTTCGGWASVVYDGITNAKPKCHSWNLVMSKEPAGFGLFDAGWPAHAAAAIKSCDGGWEKGSILDAWPSGYLKVLPWNNWKTTYGLEFTPSFAFDYSEYTEETGGCSL